MTMVPFSPRHLQMLDVLPEAPDPRRRWAGQFVEIGRPKLEHHALRSARRRRGWREPLSHVVASAVTHIYRQIVSGRYTVIVGCQAKKVRICRDIDNYLRSAVRRDITISRRFRPLDPSADRWVHRPDEQPAALHPFAPVPPRVRQIRTLPLNGVDRLVLLLITHARHVTTDDVTAAVAASRVVIRQGQRRQDGVTRTAAELFELIHDDLLRPLTAEEVVGPRGTQAALRRRLAWVLRGPSGQRVAGAWSADAASRAENWLDHRRAAIRRRLEDIRLETLEPDLP